MTASPFRGFASLVFCALMLGCAPLSAQKADFTPHSGQAGKDVIWIPTPEALVTRMLQLAQIRPDDYVVDLGSGDGRIVIAAARDFKARGLGIEYNADMVAFAQRRAREAGVADRARFVQGDIFATDFSDATIVTMYLLPELNMRLRHTLLQMKPGTRLVTHQFTMGDWTPDEVSTIENRPGYLWIVPANAGGTWTLHFPQAGGTGASVTARMVISQRFQTLDGTVELPGDLKNSLSVPRLRGRDIQFSFTDPQGVHREFRGTVDDDRMQGTVSGGGSSAMFTAERVGSAPKIAGSSAATQAEVDAVTLARD